MNANTLKQKVLLIVNELKAQQLEEHHGPYITISYQGASMPKKLWEISHFRSLIDGLSEDTTFQKYVSLSLVIGGLINLINKIKESDNPSVDALDACRQYLTSFETISDFVVYLPIKGLSIVSAEYSLSNQIRILNINTEIAKKLIPFSENEKHTIEQLIPTAIEVKVRAHDFVKAMELAIEIGRMCIHFLRFVDYYGWDEEDLSLRLPGYGSIREGLRPIAVSEGRTFSWLHREATEEAFEIDLPTVEDLNTYGARQFGELLAKKLSFNLNEMEQALFRSFIWFGESKWERDQAARFLKLMLAVECLVHSNTNDPITATLRERVAFILKDDLEERLKMVKDMNDLYNLRSKIVHHASSQVPFESVLNLEYIVVCLIEKFLIDETWARIETKAQLQEETDKRKFS
jgi:hypothetical protein